MGPRIDAVALGGKRNPLPGEVGIFSCEIDPRPLERTWLFETDKQACALLELTHFENFPPTFKSGL